MTDFALTDKDVIDLVRKDFERRVSDYCSKKGIDQEPDQETDEDGDEAGDAPDSNERKPPSGKKTSKLSIQAVQQSVGLRTKHVDSGLEYYIRGVNPGAFTVDLETSEGQLFQVDFQEFEEEYQLG